MIKELYDRLLLVKDSLGLGVLIMIGVLGVSYLVAIALALLISIGSGAQ